MEFFVKRSSDDWLNGESQLASSAPTSSPLCAVMGRRAASFPVVNHHQLPLMPPFPTMRSQSESAVLNRLGLVTSHPLIVNQLKRPETCPSVLPSGFTTRKCESMPEAEVFSEEEASTDTSSTADDSEESDTLIAPSNTSDHAVSPNSRKSVRFADTCGKPLSTVKVMSEPSDYPPNIDPAILRRHLGEYYTGGDGEEDKPSSTWLMGFKQPASEYLKFHDALERDNVALENVVLKNEVSRMVGTIKVKNIAFEKKVFLRLTSDSWATHTDFAAAFQSTSSRTADTFAFDFPITPSGDDPNVKIEFCVCFEAGPFTNGVAAQQFWDSNGGKNYCLVNRQEPVIGTAPHHMPLFGKPDKTDVYVFGNYENWSRFASWKDVTDAPYW